MNDQQAKIQTVAAGQLPVTIAGVLLLFSVTAGAQEWRWEPEVRVGFEYDDNAYLRSDPAEIQEIDGWVAEGTLGMTYSTPRTTFNLTPTLRSRVYDETPDVDSNDGFLNFSLNHETLKSNFGIRGTYAHESIRTGERAAADPDVDDPDDIPNDETGLSFINEPRDRFYIRPEWNYNFTERTSFGMFASYLDVTYDDSVSGGLVDYNDTQFVVSLSRQFSQRTRGYIGGGVRQYENDEGTNDVDGIGALIGLQSDISETTSWLAEVGYEDTEQSATGESDNVVIGRFNIVRQLETTRWLAQYRRDVTPSGTGRVSERDSFDLSFKKDFTERVTGGLGVRAYTTNPIGDFQTTISERDQVEFRAELSVALSRAFLVEADYRYTDADSVSGAAATGSADSNNFFIWLIYRPTPIVN